MSRSESGNLSVVTYPRGTHPVLPVTDRRSRFWFLLVIILTAVLLCSFLLVGPGRSSAPSVTPVLTLNGDDPTTVSLTWNQDHDNSFDNYTLSSSNVSASGPWTVRDVVLNAGSTGAFFAGMVPGSTSFWQVVDYALGNGTASNVLTVVQPSNATLTFSNVDQGNVTLTWTNGAHYTPNLPSIHFDAYNVMEKSGTGFVLLANIPYVAATSYRITFLQPGTNYTFEVVTNDTDATFAEFSVSNVVNVTTLPTALTVRITIATDSQTGFDGTTAYTDTEQNVVFKCFASGGIAPYNYTWFIGTAVLPNSTYNTTWIFGTPGNYGAFCEVRDQQGTVVNGSRATVVVTNPPTILSFTSTGRSVALGTTVSFTVTMVASPPGLSYVWSGFPQGCRSADTQMITCGPEVVGNYSILVSVTDRNNASVTSAPILLTVTNSTMSPPGLPLGSSWNPAQFIEYGIVAAVFVVGGIFIWLRRPKKTSYDDKPADQPTEPDPTTEE